MKKHNLLLSLLVLLCASTYSQSYVPEKQQSKMKVKPVVPVKAYSFNLQDVQLLDGPFKKAMEADVRYLQVIEPDRLLADFREHAGLKAKGAHYGGWEHSGLAGHTLGHYLSAFVFDHGLSHHKKVFFKKKKTF